MLGQGSGVVPVGLASNGVSVWVALLGDVCTRDLLKVVEQLVDAGTEPQCPCATKVES